MNSAKELINWFWTDVKFYRNRPRLRREVKGVCQCGTEDLIKRSSDPSRMRSFMMVGALIDQMMWTHFQHLYPVFSDNFRYPKVHSHSGPGMATPNWMGYTHHGYDKKIDWNVVSEVCDLLLNDLYDWFNDKSFQDEIIKFQEILKSEVNMEFETVNRDKLMPIIERIEQERSL